MENNRGRSGGKHEPDQNCDNHNVRGKAFEGFEGMNFEQQRGSYENNDGKKEPAGVLKMRYLKSKDRTSN